MKIIIKDKAKFAILLVLLTEIALFIAGLLIGWIEPNSQRFVAISLVAVVSVATAVSAIEIERKTPEEPQSLDTLDGAINYCITMAKMAHFSSRNKPEDKKYADELEQNYRQLAKYLIELKQWHRVYGICPSYEMCIPECKEGYNAQIAEYKRLLKSAIDEWNFDCEWGECGEHCTWFVNGRCAQQWSRESEVLKLIGKDGEQVEADKKEVRKMNEYVRLQDVLETLKKANIGGYITDRLLEIPAADVQPVKRGKWTRVNPENALVGVYKCTSCGETHMMNRTEVENFKYCPYCGARMDLGEENNEI